MPLRGVETTKQFKESSFPSGGEIKKSVCEWCDLYGGLYIVTPRFYRGSQRQWGGLDSSWNLPRTLIRGWNGVSSR